MFFRVSVKGQGQNRRIENLPIAVILGRPWFKNIFTKFGNKIEITLTSNGIQYVDVTEVYTLRVLSSLLCI